MSTAVVHGTLSAPGSLGLSTEDPALATDPNVAWELDNAAYDNHGRVCARKGWAALTTTGDHSDSVDAVFEYVKSNTVKHIISAAGNKVYSGTTTLTNITSTTAPTNDDWVFTNFNGKVVGTQASHTPIVWSGTSVFTDITASAGTLPTGGISTSAFGRLWVTDANDSAVKFSDSLDETDWGGAGAGSIDFTLVWPDGLDKVMGMAEWQGRMVFFGERSTLIYSGPEDPTASTFVLDDIIRVGCVAHKSIAAAHNDLLFLAVDGLHSLQRAIEFSNAPQEALALGVRTALAADVAQVLTTPEAIHCEYSRLDGFYLARLGTKYWHIDLKAEVARASRWIGIGFKSLHSATDGTLYFGQTGVIADYSGYTDDTSTYTWRYKSAFLSLADGREIYPKTGKAVVVSTGGYVLSMTAAYDYIPDEHISQCTLDLARTIAEWQPADVATTAAHEWGTAEWSGGPSIVALVTFDLFGAGELVQFGLQAEINGSALCLQRIEIISRLGRIAA